MKAKRSELTILDVLVDILALLQRGNEGGHTLGQVWRKLSLKDLCHDTEKDKARLSQSTVVHGQSLESGLHHVLEVRPKNLGTDGVGQGTDGVGGDAPEVRLVLLLRHGDERYESLDGLVKVGLELGLGGMRGRSDRASDGDLDGHGASLEQYEQTLEQEGEVVDNVVAEDLEIRVETRARVLLRRVVDNQVEQDLGRSAAGPPTPAQIVERTHRDDGGVTGGTLFGEPFTQTSQGDTGRLPDNDLLVVETGLDGGPQSVDVRTDVFAAALDRDTERHEGRFAHRWVRRAHVDLELRGKNGEDLLGRQSLRQGIETSECELKSELNIRFLERNAAAHP